MFDALARLADGNARRIGLLAIAFFLVAGAVGGSVANRLNPYGADDPATETVKAREQLQDAGLRFPVGRRRGRSDAPVAKASSRAQVEALERERAAPRRRRRGERLLRHPLPRLRLPRRRLELLRRLAEGDRRQSGAGNRRRDRRSALDPRRASSSAASRSPRSRSTSRSRTTCGWPRCIAFPLLFLLSLLFFRSLVASVLPLMIGGLAIVGTFLILRDRQRIRLDLDLRPQPDHGPGAGAGDRLQPLHRLPLPRGDRQGRPRAWRRCGGCSPPPGGPSSSPR